MNFENPRNSAYLYLPVELTVFGSLQVSHYNRCYNHTELQIITEWLQDDFLDLLNTFSYV